MSKEVGVIILGGTGYGAGELLRLLTFHPSVEVHSVISSSAQGKRIDSVHKHLRGFYELEFSEAVDFGSLTKYEKVAVFSALPHGTSGEYLEKLYKAAGPDVESKLLLIDLSGDLRLKNEGQHSEFYPDTPFLTEFRERFVYGLCELNREEITQARFITSPGCIATACELAALPIITEELEGALVFDAKTGSTGSGKALKEITHHPTRVANFSAYKTLAHQHEPEIQQTLKSVSKSETLTSLATQSLPLSRGIFVTVHGTFKREISQAEAEKKFAGFYNSSPFIRLVKDSPQLQNVVGTNFCDISVKVRGRQFVVLSAIDNLVKGMVGQAIQNMNLMLGIPEKTGIFQPALGPGI